MQSTMEGYLRDWFLTLMTGLGVTFAWNEWVGGLFLAVAGATIAFHSDPERDNRERVMVYVTALFVAHIAGIISHRLFDEWPPQFAMCAAGFFSRKIIRLALRVAGLVEARGDRIADGLLDRYLPGTRPPGDRRPPPIQPEEREDGEGQ